jgi:tetratricopeptide (TPR) repeat protein
MTQGSRDQQLKLDAKELEKPTAEELEALSADLQISLGNQALILKARGDLDGAMALHKEEERICRQLGDSANLQRSLGNQALILEARGDLDGAMALHKEEERICRELGNPAGLARSLANQALLLGLTMGRPRAALPLAEEVYRLASQHGLTALAEQIRPFLDRLRQGE